MGKIMRLKVLGACVGEEGVPVNSAPDDPFAIFWIFKKICNSIIFFIR